VSDLNIKKVRISANDLPAFGAVEEGYTLRYRVVSDDRNRFSAWSPFYFMQKTNDLVLNQDFILASVSDIGTSKQLTLVWEPQAQNGITQYDVYLKLAYTGTVADYQWTYLATSVNTIFNLVIPSGVIQIDAVVQVPTPTKGYNADLVLYKTSEPIDVSV
jgi:hypothetical protein